MLIRFTLVAACLLAGVTKAASDGSSSPKGPPQRDPPQYPFEIDPNENGKKALCLYKLNRSKGAVFKRGKCPSASQLRSFIKGNHSELVLRHTDFKTIIEWYKEFAKWSEEYDNMESEKVIREAGPSVNPYEPVPEVPTLPFGGAYQTFPELSAAFGVDELSQNQKVVYSYLHGHFGEDGHNEERVSYASGFPEKLNEMVPEKMASGANCGHGAYYAKHNGANDSNLKRLIEIFFGVTYSLNSSGLNRLIQDPAWSITRSGRPIIRKDLVLKRWNAAEQLRRRERCEREENLKPMWEAMRHRNELKRKYGY